jgi:uncharacterized protein
VRVSRQLLPRSMDYNAVAVQRWVHEGTHMINRVAITLACILFSAAAVAANNAPASDASIREMLELTNAQQMITGMKGQMTAMMNSAMQNALKGQNITPQRQAVLDRMAAKMSTVVTDMLNWDDLLPIYMRTYRDSFSQDEIDGAIKFYKTPAGQAYVKKLPLVMQNVMREMQGFMKPAQDKMLAIQRESMQELKALPDQDAKK